MAVPALLFAAGLLFSGCALFGQEKPKNPPPPPKNSDEDLSCGPEENRPPDAGRVRIFEGLTLEDFQRGLAERPEKEAVLKELKSIIEGGDPQRVDPGMETVFTAFLFNCRSQSPARHLMPFKFKITDADANLYLAEHNQKSWEKKKEEIAKEFKLSLVQHPLAQSIDNIPITETDTLRGLPAFDRLAQVLWEKIPEIKTSRELKALYPGSGSHIAPLMSAIKLIDEGKIDRATFIYTEINLERGSVLIDNLRYVMAKGVFDQLTIGKRMEFPGNGSERTLELSYKGRPIRILFAANRSGKEYYREEYLKSANLVILHDPGTGYLSQSFDLLAHLLLKRKNLALSQNQLVIMEGNRSSDSSYKEKVTFPAGMSQAILPGPYGHCGVIQGVGEIQWCQFGTARAFLLNDAALHALAVQYTDPFQLSSALYQDLEPKVYISVEK